MKHRTPANNNAGDTFTASINNMMRAERHSCPHAYRALALFAAFGNCAEYRATRQHFANAYAARAERRFNQTMLTLALASLALLAALVLSSRA